MKRISTFEEFEQLPLNEDTSGGGGFTGPVAFAGLANTTGMGNVVASQPSSVPGNVANATVGSGDIGSGWTKARQMNSMKNDFQYQSKNNQRKAESDLFGSSKRRMSKLTRGIKKKNQNNGLFAMNSPKKSGKIKSFSDFKK